MVCQLISKCQIILCNTNDLYFRTNLFLLLLLLLLLLIIIISSSSSNSSAVVAVDKTCLLLSLLSKANGIQGYGYRPPVGFVVRHKMSVRGSSFTNRHYVLQKSLPPRHNEIIKRKQAQKVRATMRILAAKRLYTDFQNLNVWIVLNFL